MSAIPDAHLTPNCGHLLIMALSRNSNLPHPHPELG